MNPHFFTAPFYFAFSWFRVQGSRFKVQGSGLRFPGHSYESCKSPRGRWNAKMRGSLFHSPFFPLLILNLAFSSPRTDYRVSL